MDKDHPQVKFGKTGILIINLGTPTQQVGGTLENI